MEIEFIGGSGFDAIYEQHKAKIFQTAMMYTKEWHTAEDITQEAFLRYYIYMEHASIDNTRQWLLTTTRNIALNYRRDRSREQLVDFEEFGEDKMDCSESTETIFFRKLWKREVFTSKNEILNSTSPTGSSVYFCTVDIYSFIHPWYGYLSF
ncbi:hypothetical protein Lac1_01830 [Claveliimonas bilis]|uniref:RNA polymerase sigma-70 region 2 domain-containing protein n=1 Tax=Claveliimonas bilis TaxID=3028070 RepID=A0ABM9SEM3_9FIRM|nr:hypothetical protein Lac1_01830 [Claveliimonas bilis]